MEHVLRFIESPQQASEALITTLSSLLLKLASMPPETIVPTIWYSVACVEEALARYLLVPHPELQEYLSIHGLISVLSHRIARAFQEGGGEGGEIPGVTVLEPTVQRWIPKQTELGDNVFQTYHLLIERDTARPKVGQEMARRFLVGMADALVHSSPMDFRGLIQALVRKRTEIELPSQWPIPAFVHADRTDPVWFIWGVLMHFWPKKQWILTKFKIFSWNNKGKATKFNRLGLIACIDPLMAGVLADFAPSESNMELSVAEMHLIEMDIEKGADYEYKLNNSRKFTKPKEGDILDEQLDQLQKQTFYMSFIPRAKN